ncbi:MAG: SdpI family protein [Methanobrevibacter sp.]|nr:SdpI family protein [Methanobrevibacter sp.]
MKIIKFVLTLAILNLIALILITLGLPDIVPIHMNLFGAVDTFGSRWIIPIIGMIPVLMGVIYILLTQNSHSYNSQNDLNKGIEEKIISAVTIFLIPFTWLVMIFAWKLYENFNPSITPPILIIIDLMVFIFVIIAIFFILLGFFIKDIKPNGYIGIRTPWTLKNELVWKKTHELGFYTCLIAGLSLLAFSLASFLTQDFFYIIIGFIIAIFVAAIIPVIYSYQEFNKITNN